jgi:hypothetical protein
MGVNLKDENHCGWTFQAWNTHQPTDPNQPIDWKVEKLPLKLEKKRDQQNIIAINS